MPQHAIIPASINTKLPETHRLVYESYPAGPSVQRRVSYGATSESSGSPEGRRGKGTEPVLMDDGGLVEFGEGSQDGLDPALKVTWRYMSRLYLLVPVISTTFFAALILLITFAWPPNRHEREAGQRYPHPILWKPLLIGIFASCTVQTVRVPIWVIVASLPFPSALTTYTSTALHTIIHELLRLSTLPLITPSPISGFHSSFYLGLGWGIAETTWGIIQGWEQLALYEDLMLLEEGVSITVDDGSREDVVGGGGLLMSPDIMEREDEADLERKVEILERMRERRDLEEVIGIPFPNIPFPLHLLWRLDTLLLNLGLTLILSSFYFNSIPIYRHTEHRSSTSEPSRYIWLVWALVTLLHVTVSLVWKVVGKVGVGAVTWGGLIVALGSVFAGLGVWGGVL